jgi:hypothetical protein
MGRPRSLRLRLRLRSRRPFFLSLPPRLPLLLRLSSRLLLPTSERLRLRDRLLRFGEREYPRPILVPLVFRARARALGSP